MATCCVCGEAVEMTEDTIEMSEGNPVCSEECADKYVEGQRAAMRAQELAEVSAEMAAMRADMDDIDEREPDERTYRGICHMENE